MALNPLDSHTHFHIRWEKNSTLDWECFSTYSEAANRANELAAPSEIFVIEEVHADCPLHRLRHSLKGQQRAYG
jgi:hypothetical protein